MSRKNGCVGMILKGYPRISESFISTEILQLESLGIPIEIYSLRQPREAFSHDNVRQIKAAVTYVPEYVFPHWKVFLKTNGMLWQRIGSRYPRYFSRAFMRALQRRKPATIRHFLQAGHLAALKLSEPSVTHLHAHFSHTPTSVALFASELTGLPFSFTAHAKDIYTSDPDQLVRKIKRAEFVVTCTRYNARYLAELLGSQADSADRSKIHTIYHGIDLNFFAFRLSPAPGPPYRILSIGRLVPKKGYDDLILALQLLDRAGLDYSFTHIGSGEMEPEVRAMVRKLGLEHRVKMLGTLPHNEVISHYRKAHCFALACKLAPNGDRDGIPNVLIEAMAVGVPVVSTNISAIPELVEDGSTGALVEPGDPASMAQAILNVLIDADNYVDVVRRARHKVEEEFDNNRCIISLHRLLEKASSTP